MVSLAVVISINYFPLCHLNGENNLAIFQRTTVALAYIVGHNWLSFSHMLLAFMDEMCDTVSLGYLWYLLVVSIVVYKDDGTNQMPNLLH